MKYIFECLYSVSIIYTNDSNIGGVINQSTGAYDGLIGYVQRHDANIFLQFVRSDSTPFEPGVCITFSELNDQPRIYYMKSGWTMVQFLDMLYLLQNFDAQTWFYLAIALAISIVTLVMIAFVLREKEVHVRDGITISIHCLWNYFKLFVNKSHTAIPNTKTAIILWACIALSIFYAISLVLMRTFISDKMFGFPFRVTEKRSIESVDDLLYDPAFDTTNAVIFRDMNMLSVLKYARRGTSERFLLEQILERKKSIIQFDKRDPLGHMLAIPSIMYRENMAIIENSQIVNMILPVLHNIQPHTVDNIVARSVGQIVL